MPTSQSLRCLLPASVQRGAPGGAKAMSASNRVVRTLPAQEGRATAYGCALGASGVQCTLPEARQRGGGPARLMRVAMPLNISRDATLPVAEPADPAPRPDPAQPAPAAAPRGRALPPIEALFPIVERVARGISGAAGYSYMGEDPDGAGLRYGLLGLRLDTGDMGAALSLARDRDEAVFAAALGDQAGPILATVTAADPTARRAPVAGSPLWQEPWKSQLATIAGRDIFRAAQNEYAVGALLMPAAERVLARPGLASGTALAMALDLLAEMGHAAGLAALEAALATHPDTPAAFRTALVAACPACRLRLEDLSRDKALAEWRPAAGSAPA